MTPLLAFELYLERSGRKKVTRDGHLSSLRRLYTDYPSWDQSIQELETALLALRKKGLKNISINRILFSVKLFAKFINRPDLAAVKLFKEEPSIKATLSDSELESILQLPRIKNIPINIWNSMTMFFAILCFSGCRPGECAKLSVDAVDFGQNCFLFADTKTHDNRYVPIHPILMEKYHLKEFVQSKDNYIFPSPRGGLNAEGLPVLSQADWNNNFKKRLFALGIKRKNVSTYSCRHSYITRMLAADVNLFKVQRIVGHRKIETTAIYTHLAGKHDQQTIQADPLGLRSVEPTKALQRLRDIVTPILEHDNRFSWEFSDNEIRIKIKT